MSKFVELEVYVLVRDETDYREIMGIYTDYIEADKERNNLIKYNEGCKHWGVKIYKFYANKSYVMENPEDCT